MVAPVKIRYFAVGEYGDQTWRPHYHLAIFGLGMEYVEILNKAWKNGFVHVGDLTEKSANYIAGYVCKKLTNADDDRLIKCDPETLNFYSLQPEFATMSLKPGIGTVAMNNIADVLMTDMGCNQIGLEGDVPVFLGLKRKRPLGRYLRKKLRERLGFKNTGTTKEGLNAWTQEMQRVCEEAIEYSKQKGEQVLWTRKGIKKALVNFSRQKILNMETKSKINSGGSL